MISHATATAALNVLTDFGDSALTSAFAVALTLWLVSYGQTRAALAVIVSFAATALLIAIGKIALGSPCYFSAISANLRSPSGHSAISLAFYGMLALLISSSQSGFMKWVPFLIVLPLITIISYSRVALGAHTNVEVFVGLGAAALVLTLTWNFLLKRHAVICPWKKFLFIIIMLSVFLLGFRAPSEHIINLFTNWFFRATNLC